MSLELPVELHFSGSTGVVGSRSVNVSETGMLVRSDVYQPPGTDVRFDIPPRYGGLGQVAWVRPAEDGSVLLGLALGRSRQVLVELLDNHLR